MKHLGGSGPNGDPITFTPDIWGYVCYKYGLRSVIDIGCAKGFNARWFFDRGFVVLGVEGFPEYVRENKLPSHLVVEHDYTKSKYNPGRNFDLSICTEFVEHVECQFVPNFVETFKVCKFVLLSHALPNQGGIHHVNEQPTIYWDNIMAEAGFMHIQDDTILLRSTFLTHERYGRNTLTLYKNLLR